MRISIFKKRLIMGTTVGYRYEVWNSDSNKIINAVDIDIARRDLILHIDSCLSPYLTGIKEQQRFGCDPDVYLTISPDGSCYVPVDSSHPLGTEIRTFSDVDDLLKDLSRRVGD